MEERKQRQTPHVFVILAILLLMASALTWLVPAGSYQREFHEAAGQTVVVPGSFAHTAPSPVVPWQLPRLLFETLTTGSAPQLIFFVLLLGGAFEIILESGAVAALCAWVIRRFRRRRVWIVPAFAAGIYNPFSVGVAQTIAELPLYSGAWLRWLLLAALVPVTAAYILRRAGEPVLSGEREPLAEEALAPRQGLVLALLFGALATVVWGVGARGWKVPEIAAVFLVLGIACGAAAGFSANRICALETAGCRKMVSGALTIGMAAALRLVLTQGGILDSVVHGLIQVVERLPSWGQLLGMFYANALLDLLITSGSGHAAVAMPLMVPLSDVLGLSR